MIVHATYACLCPPEEIVKGFKEGVTSTSEQKAKIPEIFETQSEENGNRMFRVCKERARAKCEEMKKQH